jgi:hypothetical protein
MSFQVEVLYSGGHISRIECATREAARGLVEHIGMQARRHELITINKDFIINGFYVAQVRVICGASPSHCKFIGKPLKSVVKAT